MADRKATSHAGRAGARTGPASAKRRGAAASKRQARGARSRGAVVKGLTAGFTPAAGSAVTGHELRSATADKLALGRRSKLARARSRVATTLDLDRLVHERLRLGIVCALAVEPSLSFNELKALLSTTDGNLSVHARKLEDAGYISSTKGFEGRLPRTDFRLTKTGRRVLDRYLKQMEDIIGAAKAVE